MRRRLRRRGAALALLVTLAPVSTALAGAAWDEIRPAILGQRTTLPGEGFVRLDAPYRAADDRRVPVAIAATLPDGRKVRAITLVVDENPMPLSAVVRFDRPRDVAWFSAAIRLNGPSTVRAIVEAEDGALFMAESFVKTSGLGACAAPPVTDPKLAAATIGRMALADATPEAVGGSSLRRRATLTVSHPNLTGLQMDQITLLYIPPRYLDRIEVAQGDERLFTLEAGITLAENPTIGFDYRPNGAGTLDVTARDTAGTVWRDTLPLGPGS